MVGKVPLDVPAGRAPAPGSGKLYVRPHSVAIEPAASGTPGFPATIVHVHRAARIVRVDLRTAWGDATSSSCRRTPAITCASRSATRWCWWRPIATSSSCPTTAPSAPGSPAPPAAAACG